MADKKDEKTLGQKLGGILCVVLMVSIFLMILPAILGVGLDGLRSGIQTLGMGAHNASTALVSSYIEISSFFNKVLMVAFIVIFFGLMLRFLFYIGKKIMDLMNE